MPRRKQEAPTVADALALFYSLPPRERDRFCKHLVADTDTPVSKVLFQFVELTLRLEEIVSELRQRVGNWGRKKDPETPERDAAIAALSERLSNGQIARRLGVSEKTIRNALDRHRQATQRPEEPLKVSLPMPSTDVDRKILAELVRRKGKAAAAEGRTPPKKPRT